MNEVWPTAPLREVCSVERSQGTHTDLPYVGLGDIESGGGRFVGPLSSAAVKSQTFKFTPKHVLYGRLRPYLKKVVLPDVFGHCSTEIFPIRPGPTMRREYLFYWLLSDETSDRIVATSTGARMPRANMSAVFDFAIPVPPLDEQCRIVAILDEAFEAIAKAKANAEKNLQNARALFESHLNAVFTQRGEGWERWSIGSCARCIDYRGRTPTKTSSGLRLITAKNVKMGRLQTEPAEFVSPDDYDSWMTRGIPQPGDVLFTTEAPLANVAQLDTDERVLFAQRIIILQPDRDRLNPTFLQFALRSPVVQQRIHERGTGATVKGIKASRLKLVSIDVPSQKSKQDAIAAELRDIETQLACLVSVHLRKLCALDELKQSFLHQAFSGNL